VTSARATTLRSAASVRARDRSALASRSVPRPADPAGMLAVTAGAIAAEADDDFEEPGFELVGPGAPSERFATFPPVGRFLTGFLTDDRGRRDCCS
jgi:hypothetical protein